MTVLFTLHRDSTRWQEDWLAILADIFGTALGASAAFTITTELLIVMVLLAPRLYKSIKNKGKAEGKAVERKAQHDRRKEAYRRFGVEVDGVRMLPNTEEVERFLAGEEPAEE